VMKPTLLWMIWSKSLWRTCRSPHITADRALA